MKIRYSLKNIVIFFNLLIFTLFLAFFSYNLFTIKAKMSGIERQQIEAVVRNNLPTMAKLLYFQLDDALEEIKSQMRQAAPKIKKITIVTKKPTSTSNRLLYPIRYKDKTLGYLLVEYDLTFTKRFFHNYAKEIAGIGLLALFFLGMLLTFLTMRIRSLNTLTEALRTISTKHIAPIKAPDRYYEIRSITEAINQLLATIKEMIVKLSQSEKHLKEAQKIANMSSWEYDLGTKTFFCSDQLYRILGIKKKEDITWERFLRSMDSDDRVLFEKSLQECANIGKKVEIITKFYTQKGAIYLKHLIKLRKRHNERKILGISLDVTEEIKAKHQIEYIAYHDILTALPNRLNFLETLVTIHKMSQRQKSKFALIYFDLDNFKFINDTFGHDVGDLLLVEVANGIKRRFRTSDLLFRIGGDEFVLILPNVTSKEDVEKVVQKLLATIAREYTIKTHTFHLTCSLGIALYPDDHTDPHELVKYADLAMYEAKREGKNRYRFFDISLKEIYNSYQILSGELKKALQKEDEIGLFLQPKVDMQTKKIVGAEVLVRWFHPTRGFISPGEFIPVAEKSDLILELDRYILQKGFALLAAWQKDPKKAHLHLAINISAKEFKNQRFIQHLKELLKTYHIDPQKMEIEITETVSMENIGYTIQTLQTIKDLGFGVALDDFGTGYSSLNYLKEIPFDTLKIDRSFIQDLHKDRDDLKITKLIVDIAQTFKKHLVAEGVELKEHEKILLDLRCPIAQGYLYYKPMSVEEFEKLL